MSNKPAMEAFHPIKKCQKKPAMEAFFPIKKYVKTQPWNDFSLSKKCQKTQPWKPGARLYCVMVMLASSLFSGVLVAFVAQAMVGWLRKWGGFSSKNGGFKQQNAGIHREKSGFAWFCLGKKGVPLSLLVNDPFPCEILPK